MRNNRRHILALASKHEELKADLAFFDTTIRSNLIYGYVYSDNPMFLSGDSYDITHYVAANLIWNPYPDVTFCYEYLWGDRENKEGAGGEALY
jgi:hypothetical protein